METFGVETSDIVTDDLLEFGAFAADMENTLWGSSPRRLMIDEDGDVIMDTGKAEA